MERINSLKKRLLPATMLAGFGAVGICVNSSEAAIIAIEPDNFPVFQDISSVVPGVQLSLIHGDPSSPVGSASIVAVQGRAASTEHRTFGRGIPEFLADDTFFESGSFTGVLSVFKASFATPTDFVAIDVIKVTSGDFGRLRAFDVSNNLVAEATTPSLENFGDVSTVSISRPVADISYILAAGFPPPQAPPSDGVALDNLKFNQIRPEEVPEPRSLLGLLSVVILGMAVTFNRHPEQKMGN